MGEGNGQKSKPRKSKGAPAVEARTAPTSVPPVGAPGELATLAARQRMRAVIVNELVYEQVGDVRSKVLATALKGINDYERAAIREEEDALDKRVASELNQIKRQKARMRSGVVREDEAPQLPVAGRAGTH